MVRAVLRRKPSQSTRKKREHPSRQSKQPGAAAKVAVAPRKNGIGSTDTVAPAKPAPRIVRKSHSKQTVPPPPRTIPPATVKESLLRKNHATNGKRVRCDNLTSKGEGLLRENPAIKIPAAQPAPRRPDPAADTPPTGELGGSSGRRPPLAGRPRPDHSQARRGKRLFQADSIRQQHLAAAIQRTGTRLKHGLPARRLLNLEPLTTIYI